MATYVYGNKITTGNDWRTWMSYETSSTDAAVTVAVKMGFQTIGGWVKSGTRSYRLTGTDQTTATTSESDVKLANGTKHTKISRSWSWTRGTTAQTVYLQARTVYSGSNQDGISTTSSIAISIPAKPSYTVSYNANGGSGAPASQKKWYGDTLTLSATTPTRTGYTFAGWNTKADGSGTNYAKSGSYTANAAVTLYAKWTANTYSVVFNANGGHGSMSNQSFTYGTAQALTANTFTLTNYAFVGWATTASGEVKYTDSQSVKNLTSTAGGSVTLYAIWTNTYTDPAIKNIKAYRCDSNGDEILSGDYVGLSFNWTAGMDANGYYNTSIDVILSGGSSWGTTITSSAGSGSVTETPMALIIGSTDTATITITDTDNSVIVKYSVDLPKGGLIMHIPPSEDTVKFFGIADEDDEGLVVNGNIYAKDGDVYAEGKSLRYTPTIGSGTQGMNFVKLYSDDTYAFAFNFKTDSDNNLPNQQYNLYALNYHNNYKGIRLRDANTSTNIWTIREVITDTFTFSSVSYTAGTIGTRGAQKSVNIEKDGYKPIGATISYVSDSSKFIPAVFFNSATNPTALVANFYRCSSAAQSGLSMSVIVTYMSI